MKKTKKKAYTFLISEDLDRGLKALKDRDGIPESETIRRALAEHLERKRVMWRDTTQRTPSRRIGLPKSETLNRE